MKQLLQLKLVDIPEPKSGEVLVKIHASGCCHTDIHALEGDWPVKPKIPLVPGHEGAGIVEAIGSDVTTVRVGDRVGIAWLHDACGSCEYCTTGWETLCTKQQCTGYSVDGCLREYAIARASHVVPLPLNLAFEEAAPILCAGVTSYKAIKEAELQVGQFIGIVGAGGGLGHLAIQYARALSLVPIALDIGDDKADYCKSLGAEAYINVAAKDSIKQVLKLTGGGVHGSLCVATTSAAFSTAIDICRRKATIVCCGLPSGSFPSPIFSIVLKRLTLRGSIAGTRKDLMEALDIAQRGLVKATIELQPLSQINHVFSKLKNNEVRGRVVIKMDAH